MIKRGIKHLPMRSITPLYFDLPQRPVPKLPPPQTITLKIKIRHLGEKIRNSRRQRSHGKPGPYVDNPFTRGKIQPHRRAIDSPYPKRLAEPRRKPRPATPPRQSGIAGHYNPRHIGKQNMCPTGPRAGPSTSPTGTRQPLSKPKPRKPRMDRRNKSRMDRIIQQIHIIPPRMRLLASMIKQRSRSRIPRIRQYQKAPRRTPPTPMIEIAEPTDTCIRIAISIRRNLHHPKRRKHPGKRRAIRLPHRRAHRFCRTDQRIDGIRRPGGRRKSNEPSGRKRANGPRASGKARTSHTNRKKYN